MSEAKEENPDRVAESRPHDLAGGEQEPVDPDPPAASMPQDDEAKDEASEAEDTAASAEASEESGDRPRRPMWKALLFGFLKLVFLVPLYLALYAILGAILFVAGVGWHYYDESAVHEIEEVSHLAAGALVRDTHGEIVGRAGSRNRLLVERSELHEHFIGALIAAEDQRFFVHRGFDPVGAIRAALTNYEAGYVKEGASTLTQQLARDVFDLGGKTADRKLKEVATAVRIESRFSKDEILVLYLNRVYFGSGFYGVGAAAKGYFGKPVSELSVDESAMLCGLIRSPSRFSPLVSRERAVENRNQTLRRMAAIGRLDPADLDALLATETRIAATREETIARGQVTYLLSRVERELRSRLPAAVLNRGELALDDYEIDLSVDLALQQEIVRRIDHHLAEKEGEAAEGPENETADNPLQAALVLLRSASGEVVAMVGSHDFHRSEYDRASEMKRPPGSAIFPFVYAAAFESGRLAPDSVLLDAPFDNREMGLGTIGGVLGEWSTENPENRWLGEIPAAKALRLSKNSPTARIGQVLGRKEFGDFLSSCGIRTPLRDQPGSLLGASEASLSELTLAYTAFANGGIPAQSPFLVRQLRDPQGAEVALLPRETFPEAMSPEIAWEIAAILGADAEGRASVKTGTTPTFTDAWAFGFDEEFTWGVWVGRDRFAPIYPLAFGKDLALPLAEGAIAGSERTPSDAPTESE